VCEIFLMIRLRPRLRLAGEALDGVFLDCLNHDNQVLMSNCCQAVLSEDFRMMSRFSSQAFGEKEEKNFKLPLPPESQGRISTTPSRSRWVKTLRSRGFGV
jgi:hypothetical protein